jgi:hypothetical protein
MGGPLSPEQVGAMLGVSGATVRRWEGGSLCPRDEDLIRFGRLCQLSHHQIDFLRTAFSTFNPPLPPDPDEFRPSAIRQLTVNRTPMVMFDELMYPRAWNNDVSVLGELALAVLHSELHPIESYIDLYANSCGELPRSQEQQIHQTIRSFWRFTAYYCGQPQYKALVSRLGERPAFRKVWTDLAITSDSSEIDIFGVGRLLQPTNMRFSMLPTFVIYPPVYHLLEFEPEDELARAAVELTSRLSEPKVEFNSRIHWALG